MNGLATTVPSASVWPGPPVIQKYMNIAGATPKFTKSARESSSAPSFELASSSRAILPSIPSHMHATRSAHSADRKRPSDEKDIDVIPAHAAIDVTRFGTIALSGTLSALASRGRLRRPLSRNRLMTLSLMDASRAFQWIPLS